jgi:hypothetical protein
MSMYHCRKNLALIWFGICAALFAVLILQTLLKKFDGNAQEIWSWFLPNALPTLSLIIGTFALHQDDDTSNAVDVMAFNLARGMSVFYLLALGAVIIVPPSIDVSNPFAAMKTANLFLGPLQGLTSAVLARFFVKNAPEPKNKE